jgi:2,7-dihydroxy-5-methyl-1-naphthoate 7-O-methyltransferase
MDLWELSDLSTPWCLHVVATLRIADLIAAGHSPITELAAKAGADGEALERVLRHLVHKGVFIEPSPGRFGLNDLARGLLDGGMRLGLDLDSFGGRMAHSWSTLLRVVRTGKPAYRELFGREFWDDLETNPKIAADFDRLIGPEGHGIPDANVLLHPDDWKTVRTVVDLGGGTGALLAEILRAHPQVHGILVDVPRVVASSAEIFETAGVADRASTSGQSFFDALPAGADLYLLKNVLADWPDAEATALLRRCAEAARPNGKVIVLSGVDSGPVADPDLLMLVLVGGKSRTLAEFREMAARAGLAIQAADRLPSGRFIVECVSL